MLRDRLLSRKYKLYKHYSSRPVALICCKSLSLTDLVTVFGPLQHYWSVLTRSQNVSQYKLTHQRIAEMIFNCRSRQSCLSTYPLYQHILYINIALYQHILYINISCTSKYPLYQHILYIKISLYQHYVLITISKESQRTVVYSFRILLKPDIVTGALCVWGEGIRW